MVLSRRAARCEHPGAVMSWSVLSTPPCSHFVSLRRGKNNPEGKVSGFWSLGRRGEGVHAGPARVTYVLMVYFEALTTWR